MFTNYKSFTFIIGLVITTETIIVNMKKSVSRIRLLVECIVFMMIDSESTQLESMVLKVVSVNSVLENNLLYMK